MSSKSGIKIKICEKEFTDLEDLAAHMTKLLDDFTNKQDDAVRKYLIKALSSFKDCIVFGKNMELYPHLKLEDFPNVCIELMKVCMRKEDVTLQSALLSCLITMTDNSNDMCEMLLDASFADLVIEQMIQIFDKEFQSKLPKSITKKDFYDQLILTVDNIINHPSYKHFFTGHPKIKQFKELIATFLKSSDARTCILTMVGLTYLIDGEIDNQQLELFKTVIDSCVKYIDRGMKHDERRCEGIRIVELMSLLETLSDIQCIKNYMIGRPQVMDLIREILESIKATEEERQKMLGIMQNLSFNDVGKKKSKSECGKLPDILPLGELARPFQMSSDDITQQDAGSIGFGNDELRYPWSDKHLKEWSKEDVCDWVRLNNLSLDQSSQLAECDGSVLEYLRSMKEASSEQYYARLKDDLKLSLKDEVIFDKAIDNINC